MSTNDEESASTPAATPDAQPPLSKNARKRLLKAERYAASKAERRARDKEKKRERAEKRRAGDADALEDAERRRAKRHKTEDAAKLGPKCIFQARVVIDLAFDDLMSEKVRSSRSFTIIAVELRLIDTVTRTQEVVSLCSQLAYTYSSNRKSRTPFKSLLYTSLNGKTLARLNTLGAHYKRWQNVDFWDEGYDQLWNGHRADSDGTQACAQGSVVYLTGDADEELEELKEGETYIIGGICDHNRYKARHHTTERLLC
jgi:tRNA (guanine9-N1)-methyltransferase